MNGMLLPILIALTVILVVWSATQGILVLIKGDKRKLKQRLSQEGHSGDAHQQASVVKQTEAPGLSGRLARLTFLNNLNRRLLQAYPDVSFARFLGLCAAAGLLSLFIALAIAPIWIALLLGAGAAYLPIAILNAKRAKRQRTIALQLPETLDFLSRILRAGHSLSTGLQMMGEELPDPLAGEFRRCYSQHSLGQSLEITLKEMAGRIESTDFAFFVTAVLIQRQTGGDLSVVLNNISSMVRDRIRLQQNVKAKTAEGRFTGYILVAFPAVMFVLSYWMSPDRTGVMLKDPTGIMLLVVAFCLQGLGLYAIRKITTVKV
jgi:tight adherence protein B